MGKRRRRRHDQSGRSEDHQYWNLPYSMARSDAFRCLPGPALKVLVELRCRYNGGNNGKITLSYEEASRLLGISKTTVKNAFDTLTAMGFLKLHKQGQWYGRKASEWALTMIHFDGQPPTNDWRLWQAPKPLKPVRISKPRYPNGIPPCFDGAA